MTLGGAPGPASAEEYLAEAKRQAELAGRAKREFLANVSHELRTPLNIIIGMLGLAVEDGATPPETREHLKMAKEAADGLFALVTDLILLSEMEAGALEAGESQFTPYLLAHSRLARFTAQAANKGVRLAIELDASRDTIFEGGYNLISLLLEKLVENAIKFGRPGGRATIRIWAVEGGEGPWLHGEVADDGPGLPPALLEGGADLFSQGDGSLNRAYGGLGLGLRLAAGLARRLGGELALKNNPGGGACPAFKIPVKPSSMRL